MVKQDQIRDKFPRKFGKYHLLGPLAQGGMGALYLAASGGRGLERLLVIKTVLPHLADAEYVARFRDEAKVVVKLSHANLIPVFDAGQVDGELFLAMDFVEGKDLRAVWNRCAKKQVAFPVDVAAYIIKELCRGLGYAHGFGDLQLVHRDISPPNILISYTGEVKLTDFGLASSTLKLEKTAPGIIYGKVAYMSPEQARGESLDGRSDLYAAAIVLWELLTGRQLFPPNKEQPQDLLHRARNPDVMPPSERAPRVPTELDAICLKALAARREDRFATGEEVREALSSWLAKEHPTTDAARVERFLRDLFAEDIARERDEREALLDRIRKRVYTLPPSDELRQMIEEEEDQLGVRRPGSVGRRATDRGTDERDRRQSNERRKGRGTHRGLAVPVPSPGPGGRTIATPTSGSAAAHAMVEEEAEWSDSGSESVIGQILDGRYRVDMLIGEGGMGRVYMAEHVDIGRRVAVKILHPVYSHMPDLVERFRREARAASRIGHPHIVDVTDSGTTADGSVYFVMEYLEGVELGNVIDREGALTVERALRIGTQICRALSAAHAAGIIHRDLKPENIYLTTRDGSADFVKVLDFGIAKTTEAEQARVRRLTSPGMAMGTPEYMAPEQAAGRPADARCDVYALGAILYETLTGVPPYDGDNFMEILTKKATIDPVPPRQLRRDVPEAVGELIIRSMARNPDARPPSMEAFEYELNKCLAGRGAAVAKILGVAAEPGLLASLNPGLSMQGGDRGLEGRGRLTPTGISPSARASSQRGASPRAFDVAAAADVDLASRGDTSSASRVAVGRLGWLLLLALLAGFVGMLVFVAFGERAARNRANAEVAAVEPPPEPAAPRVVEAAPAPAEVAAEEPVLEQAPQEHRVQPKPAKQAKLQPAPRRTAARAPDAVQGLPSSAQEAERLLAEAKAFVSQLDYPKAIDAYDRVSRGKFYRSRGLLGLAKVAFERGDAGSVVRYARAALVAGAGDPARVMLGHGYLKQGKHREALTEYREVLAHDPAHKEAQRGATEAERMLAR